MKKRRIPPARRTQGVRTGAGLSFLACFLFVVLFVFGVGLQAGSDEANVSVEGASTYRFVVEDSMEKELLYPNGSDVRDCTEIEQVMQNSYRSLNDMEYLRAQFGKDLDEFNHSRGAERACGFTLGFSHRPCTDKDSCFADCYVMPMCGDLAYSEYFLNYSMFVYNVTLLQDKASARCRAVLGNALQPKDFLSMSDCLNRMEEQANQYLSSPLVGVRNDSLQFCLEANFSFLALERMRERLRQISLAQATPSETRISWLCRQAAQDAESDEINGKGTKDSNAATAPAQPVPAIYARYEQARLKVRDLADFYPDCVDLGALKERLSNDEKKLSKIQDRQEQTDAMNEQLVRLEQDRKMLESGMADAIAYCDCASSANSSADAIQISQLKDRLRQCLAQSASGGAKAGAAQNISTRTVESERRLIYNQMQNASAQDAQNGAAEKTKNNDSILWMAALLLISGLMALGVMQQALSKFSRERRL